MFTVAQSEIFISDVKSILPSKNAKILRILMIFENLSETEIAD